MCGHRRLWYGMTLQERRQLQKAFAFASVEEIPSTEPTATPRRLSNKSERAWLLLCRQHHWRDLKKKFRALKRNQQD
jgi:hypothetical protein